MKTSIQKLKRISSSLSSYVDFEPGPTRTLLKTIKSEIDEVIQELEKQ